MVIAVTIGNKVGLSSFEWVTCLLVLDFTNGSLKQIERIHER